MIRRIAAALAAGLAAVAVGCGGGDEGEGSGADGGPLAWAAEPKLIRAPTAAPARILQGVVRNESDRRLELKAQDVVLHERDGDAVEGSAIFLSGYVRPGEPQNRGPDATFSRQEAERLGKIAVIEPGENAPLVVSWNTREGRPVRVEYPGGRLSVPAE